MGTRETDINQPKVSAIFGNFNGTRFIKNSLRSLENQSYKNIETIFVDDNSTDGSVELVRREFPSVHVIQNTNNVEGFAACCDAGARVATSDYLLFLNVDTEFDSDCVRRLVNRLLNDSSIGVCGPKLLSLNQKDRIVSTGGLLDLFGYGIDRGLDEIDAGKFSTTEEMSFITGAVVLVRRGALWAAGGWDVDTFAYAEDSDLCWRVILQGYKVVYEPSSVAFHFQSPTMGRASSRKIFYMERNRLTMMIKNHSLSMLIEVMPVWFLIATARILFFASQKRIDIVRSSLRAYYAVLCNLRLTLRKREAVQLNRRVSDREAFRHFAMESLEARLVLSGKFGKGWR